MGVGPRLAWGEEVLLDGRTIKVERPVEAPDEKEAAGGMGVDASSVLVAAYSLVTITNTGSEPLTCVAQEFSLMGKQAAAREQTSVRRKRQLDCRTPRNSPCPAPTNSPPILVG